MYNGFILTFLAGNTSARKLSNAITKMNNFEVMTFRFQTQALFLHFGSILVDTCSCNAIFNYYYLQSNNVPVTEVHVNHTHMIEKRLLSSILFALTFNLCTNDSCKFLSVSHF